MLVHRMSAKVLGNRGLQKSAMAISKFPKCELRPDFDMQDSAIVGESCYVVTTGRNCLDPVI